MATQRNRKYLMIQEHEEYEEDYFWTCRITASVILKDRFRCFHVYLNTVLSGHVGHWCPYWPFLTFLFPTQEKMQKMHYKIQLLPMKSLTEPSDVPQKHIDCDQDFIRPISMQ